MIKRQSEVQIKQHSDLFVDHLLSIHNHGNYPTERVQDEPELELPCYSTRLSLRQDRTIEDRFKRGKFFLFDPSTISDFTTDVLYRKRGKSEKSVIL